jgi:hypothetical protein
MMDFRYYGGWPDPIGLWLLHSAAMLVLWAVLALLVVWAVSAALAPGRVA